MPTRLTLAEHRAVIVRRAADLGADAAAAGLDAPVPTCPGWTVADLVAHQGMVHRWAAGHLRGEAPEEPADHQPARADAGADLQGWYDDGVRLLLAAIDAADDDLPALVFLPDAPPARRFWARRQAHETLVHAVDARSARLGRIPEPGELELQPELAADGLDELLHGFVPRPRSRLRSQTPSLVRIRAIDIGRHWDVRISSEPPQTRSDGAGPADVELAAPAAVLDLLLWNRVDPPADLGPETRTMISDWQAHQRVLW